MSDCAEKNQSQSHWKPIGRYAMRSDPYTIAKYLVNGTWVYYVWKDGTPNSLGHFKSFDSAMKIVKANVELRGDEAGRPKASPRTQGYATAGNGDGFLR